MYVYPSVVEENIFEKLYFRRNRGVVTTVIINKILILLTTMKYANIIKYANIWLGLFVTLSRAAFVPPQGVQRNYNEAILWVNGFVKCYDAPYSQAIDENIFAACKEDSSWVFVGAKSSSETNSFLLGGYGLASNVFTATKIANLAYEHNGLFWYKRNGFSFGFSSTPDIFIVPVDNLINHHNRLSWRLGSTGGGRAAQFLDLNEGSSFRKIIYKLRNNALSPTVTPTTQLPACSVPNRKYLGDGFCDSDIYNNQACDYDRGDCCEATCVSRDYVCGFNGYRCLQPSDQFPTRLPTPAPSKLPTIAPSGPTAQPTFEPSSPTIDPTSAPSASPSTAQPTIQPTVRGTSSSVAEFRFESSFPYSQDDVYLTVEFPGVSLTDETIYHYLTSITFSDSTRLRQNIDYITFYTDDSLSAVFGAPQYSGDRFPGMNGEAALGFQAFRFVFHFHAGPGKVPADHGYIMNVAITRLLIKESGENIVTTSNIFLGMSPAGSVSLIIFLVILAVCSCCALPFWYFRSQASAKVAAEVRERRIDRVKTVRGAGARAAQDGKAKKIKSKSGEQVLYAENIDKNEDEEQLSKVISFNKGPPEQFICSISCDLMSDPVICSDGFTYDRASISQWLSTHDTSPMTNIPLPNKRLIPNTILKELIDDYQHEMKK